jgi:hypothetical protein
MKLLRLRKPSPATVIACIALFVALGGTSVAAVTLAKNSVLSKHIKNGQVKTADLGASAVNSAKVGDGSLLAQDFAAGQLAAGPAGPPGPPGPSTGPAGGDLAGTYPNPEIGANKVEAAELSDNSVDLAAMLDNSVGTSEIVTDGVGSSELANNAVGSAEVLNASLTTADVAIASGATSLDFPSMAANTCSTLEIITGGNVDSDPTLIMADNLFTAGVSVSTSDAVSPDRFQVRACNNQAITVDPGAATFFWVVFNRA